MNRVSIEVLSWLVIVLAIAPWIAFTVTLHRLFERRWRRAHGLLQDYARSG